MMLRRDRPIRPVDVVIVPPLGFAGYFDPFIATAAVSPGAALETGRRIGIHAGPGNGAPAGACATRGHLGHPPAVAVEWRQSGKTREERP
jgi:hypothetical protein